MNISEGYKKGELSSMTIEAAHATTQLNFNQGKIREMIVLDRHKKEKAHLLFSDDLVAINAQDGVEFGGCFSGDKVVSGAMNVVSAEQLKRGSYSHLYIDCYPLSRNPEAALKMNFDENGHLRDLEMSDLVNGGAFHMATIGARGQINVKSPHQKDVQVVKSMQHVFGDQERETNRHIHEGPELDI